MAEEEENSGEAEDSLLAQVQSQAKTNRLILIFVIMLFIALTSVAVIGLSVMFSRITALTEAAEMDSEDLFEEQFINIEEQLLLLSSFRKKELKKIVAYTKQLNNIRNDCSIEKATPYGEFLTERETDFQQLLTAISSGTASLAGMNKGNRKWVAPYQKSLEELKKKSIERKKKLTSLIAKAK